MNILIKLMSIVSLVIAPYIAVQGGMKADKAGMLNEAKTESYAMDSMDISNYYIMGKCNIGKCMTMNKEECASYCDSMKCSPEEKAMCQSMYGADGKFDMAKCKAMCTEKDGCCRDMEEEKEEEVTKKNL
jgi:K(+)-stimulated pyrophosphate-energized sodium pump